MKIGNEQITDDGSHLVVRLREPFWSAWKKYGWTEGIEGFGINVKVIDKAVSMKRKLKVSYKYGIYTISTEKAQNLHKKYGSSFKTRSVTLAVLPRSEFDRVPTEKIEEEYQKKEIIRAKITQERLF